MSRCSRPVPGGGTAGGGAIKGRRRCGSVRRRGISDAASDAAGSAYRKRVWQGEGVASGWGAAHLDVAHHADDALHAQEAQDTEDEDKDDDALGALDDRQDDKGHGGEEVDEEGAVQHVEARDDGAAMQRGAEEGAGEADGHMEAHEEVREEDETHREVQGAGGGGDEVRGLEGGADGDPQGGVGCVDEDDEGAPVDIEAAVIGKHRQAEDAAAVARVALLYGHVLLGDGLMLRVALAAGGELGGLCGVLDGPEFGEELLRDLALDEEDAEQGIGAGGGSICGAADWLLRVGARACMSHVARRCRALTRGL